MAEKNVLGQDLEICSCEPMTGFSRDGYCKMFDFDPGQHTLCALMTNEFLVFSKEQGNDLSTPRPEYNFPGLKEGDKWCLCVLRWVEAFKAGMAPPVYLEATHESALLHVALDDLKRFQLQ